MIRLNLLLQPTGGETPTRHSGKDDSLEGQDEITDRDLEEKVSLKQLDFLQILILGKKNIYFNCISLIR